MLCLHDCPESHHKSFRSIWNRVGEFVARIGSSAACGLTELTEGVRRLFGSDPELRRRVAFSVAMIALSAKMAKADGVVTQDEIRAFQEIFAIPAEEARNVARLYDIARGDTAGFEAYAARMAQLCSTGEANAAVLQDVLDGLFHVAKADGLLHELEGTFLRRVAEIFHIDEAQYAAILARHVDMGVSDPYAVLGVGRDASFEEVRRQYRKLVNSNHPDRLIARGLPEEFIAIATMRLASINSAFESIERVLRPA